MPCVAPCISLHLRSPLYSRVRSNVSVEEGYGARNPTAPQTELGGEDDSAVGMVTWVWARPRGLDTWARQRGHGHMCTAMGAWLHEHGHGGTTNSARLGGPGHVGTATGAWPCLPFYMTFLFNIPSSFQNLLFEKCNTKTHVRLAIWKIQNENIGDVSTPLSDAVTEDVGFSFNTRREPTIKGMEVDSRLLR